MLKLLRLTALTVLACALAGPNSTHAQSAPKPFRVAIAGLVHGHVAGFLSAAAKRPDIQIVGIAEPDQQLAKRYAGQFKL